MMGALLRPLPRILFWKSSQPLSSVRVGDVKVSVVCTHGADPVLCNLANVQAEIAVVRFAFGHMQEGSSSEHSYSGDVCTKHSPYNTTTLASECHGDNMTISYTTSRQAEICQLSQALFLLFCCLVRGLSHTARNFAEHQQCNAGKELHA